MSKHPGIYRDIGKKARDLLYGDYTHQQPIHYHRGHYDWSFNISCQINGPVPGLRTTFKFFIPYQRLNKVELQYLHDFAGITAGTSLTAKPLIDFSGATGTSFFSIGTDLSFDTAIGKFAKCNTGFSFNSAILIASLTLNDKAQTLTASCYRSVNPPTNTAVAADLTHRFLSRETALAFGIQHNVFPTTTVKVRVNSNGEVGALVQQELLHTLFLTLSGELDFKAVARSSKVGLSLAIKS